MKIRLISIRFHRFIRCVTENWGVMRYFCFALVVTRPGQKFACPFTCLVIRTHLYVVPTSYDEVDYDYFRLLVNLRI